MKKSKKVSKSILDRINLINSLIPKIEESENFAYTYAGGTYPYQVRIKPITVKNQFVTIENNGGTFIRTKERFNINNKEHFEECGLYELKNSLSIILKAFKAVIKNK
jgi:hypothetical protein